MQIALGADLVDLGNEPERGAVTDHRLLGLQGPRVELRRPAEPQRMARRGQRHAQPADAERPQSAERQRQTDGPVLARKPRHTVRCVLGDNRERRVIGRDKSTKKGISPGRQASGAWFSEHAPHLRSPQSCQKPDRWNGPWGRWRKFSLGAVPSRNYAKA